MKNITAVLGPTNTGKTHMALERMLAHKSGMIGLPLRLLAREIYDRCRQLRPDKPIALITGEEKIIPAKPDFFICTVEAMPSDVGVEFLAIDEIQLCADPERGHIFTDRILHWRGSKETFLLGAETIKPLLKKLLPDINFQTRSRLSKLSYGGIKKISRLPKRTAIIAFNSEKIYAIAELVRRQKGGAAVVMGSLSPRTRNAQVELFQSGDVPYLVATDAIGMGLNMHLNHVAFASTRKYDGKKYRELTPAELSQIAGRAGRHTNDGTFGTTADAAPLSEPYIEQIEDHRFEPIKTLYWRNRDPDFGSLELLRKSLQKKAPESFLQRPIGCSDTVAFETLRKQEEIKAICIKREDIQRLWSVCQIPDYRNISPHEHCHLLRTLFSFLKEQNGTIPEDWLSKEVNYADRSEGDIDTLANRLAHIRTWTYVSNKQAWLEDSIYWQEKTRAIEDRLSDALHQKLMARFVDRKTSLLMKRLRQREDVKVSLMDDGKIVIEDEVIGELKGFQFEANASGSRKDDKTLKSTSSEIISEELKKRADSFLTNETPALEFGQDNFVRWEEHIIVQLKAGDGPLRIRTEFICDDLLSPDLKEKLSEKVQKWLDDLLAKELEPLFSLSNAEDINGLAKGVAFQLVEARGMLARETIANDIKLLDQDARKQLRKYGVRFGAFHIFMPALLKPAPAKLLLLFWALANDITEIPTPPPNGLTSLQANMTLPEGYYSALGYKICGNRAARIDMLERLADMIRPVIFWKAEQENDTRPEGSFEGGGFTVTPDMMSLLGCSGEEFSAVLSALGYYPQNKKTSVVKNSVQTEEQSTKESSEESAAEELVEVWLPNKKKNNFPSPKRKKAKHKNTGRTHGANDKKKKTIQSKTKTDTPGRLSICSTSCSKKSKIENRIMFLPSWTPQVRSARL